MDKQYFKNNLEVVKKRLLETLTEEQYNNGIEILRLCDTKHQDSVIDDFIELKINSVLDILYTHDQVNDLKSILVLKECIYYASDDNVKITVENFPVSPYDDQQFIVFEYDDEYVYLNTYTKKFSFKDK